MTDLHVIFWHWWGLAGILLALEVSAPGVFFLWVALGALVSGIVALVLPTLAWETEAVIMMAVAVATAFIGRRFYPRRKTPDAPSALNRRSARLVGRVVTLEQPIAAGSGRAALDGTHWTVTGPDSPVGSRMRIVDVEDTILKVLPE